MSTITKAHNTMGKICNLTQGNTDQKCVVSTNTDNNRNNNMVVSAYTERINRLPPRDQSDPQLKHFPKGSRFDQQLDRSSTRNRFIQQQNLVLNKSEIRSKRQLLTVPQPYESNIDDLIFVTETECNASRYRRNDTDGAEGNTIPTAKPLLNSSPQRQLYDFENQNKQTKIEHHSRQFDSNIDQRQPFHLNKKTVHRPTECTSSRSQSSQTQYIHEELNKHLLPRQNSSQHLIDIGIDTLTDPLLLPQPIRVGHQPLSPEDLGGDDGSNSTVQSVDPIDSYGDQQDDPQQRLVDNPGNDNPFVQTNCMIRSTESETQGERTQWRMLNNIPYPKLTLQNNILDPLLFLLWTDEVIEFCIQWHIPKNTIFQLIKAIPDKQKPSMLPEYLRGKITMCDNWDDAIIELQKNFEALISVQEPIKTTIRGKGPLIVPQKSNMYTMRQHRLIEVQQYLHLYVRFFENQYPLQVEDYKAAFMSFYTLDDMYYAQIGWQSILMISQTPGTNIREALKDSMSNMKNEYNTIRECNNLWERTKNLNKDPTKYENMFTPNRKGVFLTNKETIFKTKIKAAKPSGNKTIIIYPVNNTSSSDNSNQTHNYYDKQFNNYLKLEKCTNPFCIEKGENNVHQLYTCPHLDKIRHNKVRFPQELNCKQCLRTFTNSPSCKHNCEGIIPITFGNKTFDRSYLCNKHQLVHYRICIQSISQTDKPDRIEGIECCGDLGDYIWVLKKNRIKFRQLKQ